MSKLLASNPVLGCVLAGVLLLGGHSLGAAAERAGGKGLIRVGSLQPRNRTIDFRLEPADALAQVEKSLGELERLVHQAGKAGCDVVALPEDTLGSLRWEAAHDRDGLKQVLPRAVGQMLARLGAAAARHRMY